MRWCESYLVLFDELPPDKKSWLNLTNHPVRVKYFFGSETARLTVRRGASGTLEYLVSLWGTV